METIQSPDLSIEAIADRLRAWLPNKIPGARDVSITGLGEPAQGFSSKTVFFTASWTQDETPFRRDLVARIQRDTGCPLLADIFHQYRVIDVIAKNSTAAVPHLFLAEPDLSVLGAPFYLMDRVTGRVPSDFPSFHAEGWFAEELTATQREQAWWNGIREMEKMHRVGWQHYPFLSQGARTAPDAAFYLEHFVGRWLEWAAAGRSFPLLETALRHLIAHSPATEQSGVVWNDARMGNTMFAADLSVASLFDFEVASLGPAEIDLAWWLYAEDIFSTQFGHARIAGIPDRSSAIAGFERIYGRSMADFDYYEAIAALKHAVISIRDYSNGKEKDESGALPNFPADRLKDYLARHGA